MSVISEILSGIILHVCLGRAALVFMMLNISFVFCLCWQQLGYSLNVVTTYYLGIIAPDKMDSLIPMILFKIGSYL